MDWTVVELGPVTLVGAAPDDAGVIVAIARSYALLTDAGLAPFTLDHELDKPALAPFSRAKLRMKDRLSWPNGATAIGAYAQIAVWGEHYAAVLDDRGLTVVDARTDRLVRLLVDADVTLGWRLVHPPVVHGGRLWIEAPALIVAIPLVDLERLHDHADARIAIALHPTYPLRRPDARLPVVYLWKMQSGTTMVEIGNGRGGAREPKLEIELPDLGLAKYSPMILCDEVVPGRYAIAEMPDHPRQDLLVVGKIREIGARVSQARANDPVPPIAAVPASGRLAELAQLVTAIGDEADADRAVLVDLLQELGDPAGEVFASARAGNALAPAKLKIALGPLAPFLTDVELRGGLPWSATLAYQAPDDPDAIAAAIADYRLGLLHHLGIRRGSPSVYAQLVGAPRATGLRRVDVAHPVAVDALIAAGRDRGRNTIERLDNVRFTKREQLRKLLDPTFDRARQLHATISHVHAGTLLDYVAGDKLKLFARAPRELVLDEPHHEHVRLLRAVYEWWPKLPIVALVIDGLTLARDGNKTTARAAPGSRDLLAAARELIPDLVEL